MLIYAVSQVQRKLRATVYSGGRDWYVGTEHQRVQVGWCLGVDYGQKGFDVRCNSSRIFEDSYVEICV
jgi:hypothetical protein